MTVVPEVSVVIPTRNRWARLSRAALPSALRQEGVELEVIVVDDYSTDGSPDRVAQLGDPRVRLVSHDRRQGVAAARNTGVAAATAGWLAFLDDDDLWAPTKLRTQLEVARRRRAAFVFGGVAVLDEHLRIDHVTRPPADAAATLAEDLLTRNTVPAGSSNVLVEAALVRDAGGFDERLRYTEDWDLWLRIACGLQAAAVPEILVGYVRHPLATQFAGARAVSELRYFAAKHRSRGLRADPAQFLAWIGSEHFAAGRRSQAVSTYLLSGLVLKRPRHLVRAASSLVGARSPVPHGDDAGRSVAAPPDATWLATFAPVPS